MTCPVCATVAVPGARFCHNCGAALQAAATLPAAERRVVTVLFGDLSDFTAWAEDVDPERVGAVTNRVLAALAGAVATFGGHVDKLTGDGIMAVFGAPVAHEDDAERAVRAALSMQRSVRRVLDDERGGGAPQGLRVGLNTGPVVAGVQAAIEYTVVGDTVNTAARLADVAAVGAVYAGSGTAGATRHIASWRVLRPLRLKGKRALVEAYELLGPLDAPGTRSGLGDEAPFVGRETELAWVASRLGEAADRAEPHVLVVTGEAGLGKTRFAAEVARLATGYPVAGYPGGASGARVLSVHCAAYGERRRLAPLADLVRLAIGMPGSSDPRAVVEERLRRLGQRLVRAQVRRVGSTEPHWVAVDLLLMLLGHTEPGTSRGDGEFDTEAIPAAVADLLSALALETPLVVIIDDLHDATSDTVDALGSMLSRLTGSVLVLLLGRPELAHTAGALTRLPDAEVTTLAPLRGVDSARLLTAYLGGGRLAPTDEDKLLATAQGNPFYLAELVALLQERGALTSMVAPEHGAARGPLWRLAPGSLGGRLLSRDLAAVLAARIDALPADSRAVLRDAAVVGDTVPAGALQALRNARPAGDGRPAAVAAVALERSVDELLQRRMLRRTRDGYAFATPLLREAAYAGIGRADLADRHAVLARWAADGVPGLSADAAAGLVAEHAERATALADAVRLRPDAAARAVAPLGVEAFGRLARWALAIGEPAQAARYAERASSLARGALTPADRLVHARALLSLGRVSDALSYAEKIAANAGDDVRVRAGALLVAGRAHQSHGDLGRARAMWQEALAAATAAELPRERAEAMRRLGLADYLTGRLADAGTRFTGAYQVALAAGDRRSQAWSLQDLAWVTVTRGDFIGAENALRRAARRFAEIRDPVGRAWLRGTAAFAQLLGGRLGEARRLARTFLPFGERVGEAWAVGTLRAVEAYAAAELGELGEADRSVRRAYRDFEATEDDWGRGLSLVVRGVVARGLGEPAHARDLLTDALAYGQKTGHPLLIGMAGTIRGLVHLELGDPVAALADASIAFDVVTPHDVLPPAQVGPRVLRAMARQASGSPAPALAELAEIAADFTQPTLLFTRKQAVAAYASALLDARRPTEALLWAQRAVQAPGEDVRSRVVSGRVLACALSAVGRTEDAVAVAAAAVREAYATQQVSERAAAEAVLAAVHDPDFGR